MGKGRAGTIQWELLAEKLLYLGMIAVVLWSFLFIDLPGHGRLWDNIRGAPPSATENMALLPSPKEAAPSQDDGKDRLLISQSDEEGRQRENHDPTTAELVARIPDAFAGEAAGRSKLTSRLWKLDDPRRAAAQRSSALLSHGASAGSGPSAAAQPSLPVYSIEAPRDEEGRTAAAATSRRNSGRNGIMSRSAGSVYNVK